jgi:hypothetical protein
LDEGIGGMGLRELLQVIRAFELQHQMTPPEFSPGIKKPAEAGYEGVGGVFINKFLGMLSVVVKKRGAG